MTNLPKRLVQVQCSFGKHKWKSVGHGLSYGGWSESSQECINCGELRKVFGGKTYEPPYWETSYKTIRKGKY